MTDQLTERPLSAAELEADANARRKAGHIALYAYRCGITFAELGHLPYSDRQDRKRPTLRRFAAAAFRAAGVDENVPHSRTSDTWRHLRTEMEDLEDRAAFGLDAPARDLLRERADWLPVGDEVGRGGGQQEHEPGHGVPAVLGAPGGDEGPDGGEHGQDVQVVEQEPDHRRTLPAPPDAPRPERRPRPRDLAPYARSQAPALMTAGSPPLLPGETIAPAPRGWDALAQLPPLQGRSCRWCGAPAIVGTLNGYRCADHPPVRGDARGDWGWGFNWAPTERTGRCLPSRCYCGRCPQYDPTGEPSGLSVRELRALRASTQRMLECST